MCLWSCPLSSRNRSQLIRRLPASRLTGSLLFFPIFGIVEQARSFRINRSDLVQLLLESFVIGVQLHQADYRAQMDKHFGNAPVGAEPRVKFIAWTPSLSSPLL